MIIRVLELAVYLVVLAFYLGLVFSAIYTGGSQGSGQSLSTSLIYTTIAMISFVALILVPWLVCKGIGLLYGRYVRRTNPEYRREYWQGGYCEPCFIATGIHHPNKYDSEEFRRWHYRQLVSEIKDKSNAP